jgi:PAT family beta-lactamase induction signal transducer AmpG
MSLCSRQFSATQFALLSAFASVGRVWVGPLAGVLAQSIGWPTFFIASTLVALPGLALLLALRRPIVMLDSPRPAGKGDDD